MPAYLIPLSPAPKTFNISLAGVQYNLRLLYHGVELVQTDPLGGLSQNTGTVVDNNDIGAWTLDISDSHNNPMAFGIPLVTGVDLLSQYKYLGIGGVLVVVSNDHSLAAPAFNDLGVNSNLYFVTS